MKGTGWEIERYMSVHRHVLHPVFGRTRSVSISVESDGASDVAFVVAVLVDGQRRYRVRGEGGVIERQPAEICRRPSQIVEQGVCPTVARFIEVLEPDAVGISIQHDLSR